MTDQPQPPPYEDQPVVVQQLAVAGRQPERVPRPRGLATVVLAIVVAVLAGYVAVLLIDAHRGATERQQLACEVQRLGGRQVGQVDCPRPTPTARPVPSLRPSPAVVVIVPPVVRTGPAGPPGPAGPAASPPAAPSPAPAAGASRAPSSPAARPSPTPTCRRPNPLPLGPACLQPGAAAPS